MERSIDSKGVGRNGDLRGVILTLVDVASTMRDERLLLWEGDAIVGIWYYNIGY